MARVRQPYDEPVSVPALRGRVVNPGQVVDVADDQLKNFTEAGWIPVTDKPAETAEKGS